MTGTELNAADEMRQQARKTAALAHVDESLLDNVVPVDDGSRVRLEDLAHLPEATDATFNAGVKLEMDARALHPQGA